MSTLLHVFRLQQIIRLVVFSAMLWGGLSRSAAFQHPGIPFSNEDIDQLKAHVAKGEAPWATAYASFAAQGQSSLGYTSSPCVVVSRAPDANIAAFRNDMIAIHNLTWMWLFTSNTAYAQKATAILDAWAVTNTYFGGDEGCLELGDYVEKLVTAADILKAKYPGWTAANTEHVQGWFENVLWPVADVPNPVRGANQGAIQLKIAVSIAAFLDDTTKWNQALSVFRNDAAGGLANSLSNGQLGDTGRDDGHWIGQLAALAWSAEVAWKQGVDMFSELDNRLLAASELWAKWSLGQSLPEFIPNGGAYQFNYPGAYAGGATPNIRQAYAYNIIENAYVRRLGLTTPQTTVLRTTTGDDAGTFLFKKTADTSTATPLPAIVRPITAPATNLADSDVGAVGLAGKASYDAGSGTWTLTGAGADIPVPPQTAVDAFNFAFQRLTGDAAIVARVTAQGAGRAGIMIRESLAADANYVGIFLNSSGGTVTTWRGATAWNKTNASWNNPPGGYQGASVPPAPWWFKLERLGTRVHVLHSPDGVNWSGIQSAEIAALPSTAYVGLCVTSQNAAALTSASFDNVLITPTGPTGSPVITSATAASATVGAAFSYSAAASGSPTSFSASGLPAGLSLNASTGAISGTPTTPGVYLVTLGATNASGTGTGTLILTVLSNTAPTAPTGVTATAVDVYNVNVAWTASANATSYTVKRATTPGGPYTVLVSGVSGTSYLDTTAPSGDVYYVVTALAGTLESAPSIEALIVLRPGIPSAPTIANGNGQVTLSWPATSGAASYTVKRAAVSGGPYTTIASGLTATSYTDIGLTNGTYYYYVISSVSSVESGNSPEEFGLPGAKTYTWSPTAASGSWNTAANWLEGVVPASPAILKFGASTTTTLSNDIAAGLEVARFTFDSDAPAYTITGNAITLGTEIQNNSVNRQKVQVPMAVARIINCNPRAGEIMLGSLSAGSEISGAGGFITRGSNPTSFLGNNTFSGGVTAYGEELSPNVFSPHTLSFSGVGTATSGPFGTGKVTLVSAVLTDTLPYVPSGSFGTRNRLYNEIHLTTGTTNAITTAGAGALDHYGNLTGGGTVEVAGWHSGWDNYSGSPVFFGDNSGFTGTFVTLTHSSFQRLSFNTATSGSAQARFSINGNINATHYIAANVSFGELSGAGAIRGNSILTVGALNTDSVWSGALSLSLSLTKVGTGTFRMTFVNTYGGPTVVNDGVLRVDMPGSLTSAVTVNSGGTFGGSGSTSSTVTVNAGGKFAPGEQGGGAFTASGILTMATGSTFALEMSSSTGTSASAVVAQTALNNATLTVSDLAPGSLPLGSVLTLINNTGSSPVSGTFNGLPEGSDVVVGPNTFVITYRGGDGNDVKLHDKRTAALPVALTGVSATAVSAIQVDLSWNPSPASEYVSSYTVKRATVPGGPYTTIATISTPSFSDTTAAYSTTYYYVINAVNFLGSSPASAEVTATTPSAPIPPAPGNVIAAVGDGKVSLSWSSAFTAESYNILRATTAGGPYTTLATGVTGNAYTDTTAVNGTSYYYVVTSTNGSGTSASSVEVGGVPATGGYSYWPFNESSGSTSADVWGSRTATLFSSNVTRVSGVSGGALRFDGTSTSYATLPTGVVSTLTGDFTLSAWVKFDALQSNQRILDFGSSNTNYLFISQNTGTTFRYGIRIGSAGEQGITTGSLPLATGRWMHVAVTLSGSTTTIFVNGVPAAAPTTSITNRPSGVTATANYFGKSQFNDPLLKGALDDVRIYTRALSAAEIASMVSPLAPAAPTNLTATSSSGAVAPVFLNWTASAQATSYNVKRATVAGGPYTVIAAGVIGTAYTDISATNGAYYYVVTPVTDTFEGLPSAEATVTLLPAGIPSVPAPVATAWNNRVDLAWAPAAGATSYSVKRSTVSGGPYTVLSTVASTAPLFYRDTAATNGTKYYYVVSAENAVGSGANSVEASATPINNPEAEVWTHADIGAVAFSGNASYDAGTWTLYGAGLDIWTQTDSFHFLYKTLTGDGAIMARIVSQSSTADSGGAAKAGVMIRDAISGVSSPMAVMDHTPANRTEFIWRTGTTVNAASNTSGSIALPRWVKVVRSGNTFSAFHSADGVSWIQQGTTQTVTMAANTYVGLVYCVNSTSKRAQATFDHVSVAAALPVITSPTSASATVGVPFSYAIAASNSPSMFSATGLPEGLTLNDATGVISGTPTKVGTGTFTVALTTTNAMGTSSAFTLTLTVSKGTATVKLTGLVHTYDGTPKAATVATIPADLAVSVKYDGSTNPPTAAGTYAVSAEVTDANYTGSANDTLEIVRATPVVSWATPASITYGTALGAEQLNATANIPGSFVYTPAAGAVLGAGAGQLLSAIFTPTDTANYNVVSVTNQLTVNKAVASVVLSGLQQRYAGQPREVTVATTPAGLDYDVTYNGSAIAPTYPGTYPVVVTVVDPNYSGMASGDLTINTTALVRHAPTLNSDIEGSVQLLLGENVTFGSKAGVANDLLVPGSPTVQINGSPTYGGVIDGPGSATPANYAVVLNSGSLLSRLVRRIDPLAMPSVSAPPAPTGTRIVALNSSGQSAGDFATLKDLTLNTNVGAVAVPPGTYGSFTANLGSSFVLGVAGATEPAVYNFQNLTFNSKSSLQVVGPVIVIVNTGFSTSGNLGSVAHPDWLNLRIANGGFTLNAVNVYGNVWAPSGTITLNGSCILNGTTISDRLTLNTNALLSDPEAK